MTNYFENLKTEDEIKKAYKEFVKKFHPDIYGEDGNDILKDVHNQLEKVLKSLGNIPLFNPSDKEDSEEIRAKKEELAREAMKHKGFAIYNLFVLYWNNRLQPSNHRNSLTKHNFTGWNIWSCELEMLTKGYKLAEWSTFAQHKANDNWVDKGQKGLQLTLAIPKKGKDEDGNDEIKSVFYKGYSVFNYEQTKGFTGKTNETLQIETKKQVRKFNEKYAVVA